MNIELSRLRNKANELESSLGSEELNEKLNQERLEDLMEDEEE